MLSTLKNLLTKKSSPGETATATPAEVPSNAEVTVHTMPNGQIGDAPVQYTLAHAFDGTNLSLVLDAGPGHTSVTAFPSNHEPAAVPMKQDGDAWTLELPRFKGGEEVEIHFVVENNGQQVDNSTERHKITLPDIAPAEKEVSNKETSDKFKMPNGLINEQQVEYSLRHAYDGSLLTLELDAGPGHTSVTAYPAPHEPAAVPMTQEGDIWKVQLQNFKEGDAIDIHFVIENNGQQCDNSSAHHTITVPAAASTS